MSSTKITRHDMDDSVFEGVATEDYAQAQHKRVTITLSVASWSNNSLKIACGGVLSSNTVVVSPAPDSHVAYGKANVRCTAQGTNLLTFVCDKVPEADLTVNVMILGV